MALLFLPLVLTCCLFLAGGLCLLTANGGLYLTFKRGFGVSRKSWPIQFVELDFVDVSVETEHERILYDTKSDLSVSTVMRLALGQLLEYAFRSKSDDARPLRLVMVAGAALSVEDLAYLDYLRAHFPLPLEYRQVRLP